MRFSNWGLSGGLDIHLAMSHPWLPPGGGSREAGGGARVKKHFLRILFLNFRKYSYFPRLNRSYRKAPSVCLRQPPPSRREAQERPRHKINTPTNPNLNASSVAPFPSVGQFCRNRTLSARSRQQGDPFDWCIMLPPRGKGRVREARAREREIQRSPCRPVGKGFKYTEMGLRFRASKARKPLPLWGIFKDPFAHERVLESVSFGTFLVRRQERYTPKPNDIAAISFSVNPNKN